jgi:flagellar capping protein FliD
MIQTPFRAHLILAALMTGILLPLHPAHAASMASASLDWANLQINLLSGNVSYSIDSYGSNVWAGIYRSNPTYAELAQDYDFASDWTTAISANATHAVGSAESTANTANQSAHAIANFADYISSASSGRSASISLTGTGLVEITVPYTLSAVSDAINPEDPEDIGYADSGVNLSASFYSDGFSDYLNRSVSLYDSAWIDAQPRSGILDLFFRVNGDTQIQISGSAHASAQGSTQAPSPVPVPAAVWLLSSALLGFVRIARHGK